MTAARRPAEFPLVYLRRHLPRASRGAPTDQPLPALAGRTLDGFGLGRSVVDLHFGAATLTAVPAPIVVRDGARLRRGYTGPAYREALVGLLGQPVRAVEIRPWEAFLFGFAGDRWLVLSLRPQDRRRREAVTYRDGAHWWHW